MLVEVLEEEFCEVIYQLPIALLRKCRYKVTRKGEAWWGADGRVAGGEGASVRTCRNKRVIEDG